MKLSIEEGGIILKDDRHKKILNYMYDYTKEKGFPPTVREIGEYIGLSSSSSIHAHLKQLEKKGYLYKDPSKNRAIEITKAGREFAEIQDKMMPLVGVVTAGSPILAVETTEDYFPIPPDLEYLDGKLFMLTIRGNSMINVGIYDGDSIMIKKQSTAKDGDVVIALNEDDEATCKTFYKEKNGMIRLQPENDTMEPIFVSADSCRILGIAVGLYRRLVK